MKRKRFLLAALVLALSALLLAACETQTVEVEVTRVVDVTATPRAVTYHDAAAVEAQTAPHQCQPLATLPTEFSQPWRLGFINPNLAHPFFGEWSGAMKSAAEFYGVEFFESDAAGDYATEPDLLETLLLNDLSIVGAHGPNVYEGLALRALDEGIQFIGIDNGPSEYTPIVYGIPDGIAVMRGAELLVEGVRKRMEDDWAGRELFFIELTHGGIPACVTRTGSAASTFQEAMGLDDDHVLLADLTTGRSAEDMVNDTMTANPDGVFAMIPCWDGLGIGPYNAVAEAGNEADVMLVTLGGDEPPAKFLKTRPMGYYGFIEFQPYCEGWGWVEVALATLEGLPFETYQVRKAITQETVDQRYAELYESE